uniref:protein fuzzy homolog isoform X2 n=2 Tax=Myxine glutinosa TaxID=7769 RepID=UPI00358F0015
MLLQVVCMAEGGIPLYSRPAGPGKQLPFSVISSLNGVHMFGGGQGVELLTTCSSAGKLAWRNFHNTITMMLVTDDNQSSEAYLQRLLSSFFDAMVLLVGLEDLANIKNVERLKRDLRSSFQLLDSLLCPSELVADITGCADCLVFPQNDLLQECLRGFVSAAGNALGCLLVRNRIAAATERWWRLLAGEVVLLARFISTLSACTSRDIPVYLPRTSPNVPYRLLTFLLLPGVEVCLLCGPQPSLLHIENELLERFWRPAFDTLQLGPALSQRGFVLHTPLHPGVLGLLLVNPSLQQSVCSVQPHGPEPARKSVLSLESRRAALRSFYLFVTETYFTSILDAAKDPNPDTAHVRASTEVTECYTCTKRYRCYALAEGVRLLCVLFSTEVPTFSLSSASHAIMKSVAHLL